MGLNNQQERIVASATADWYRVILPGSGVAWMPHGHDRRLLNDTRLKMQADGKL